MKGKTGIATGATALAAAAAMFGASAPASAAPSDGGSTAQGAHSFSIEYLAVPRTHSTTVTPNFGCCNLRICEG